MVKVYEHQIFTQQSPEAEKELGVKSIYHLTGETKTKGGAKYIT